MRVREPSLLILLILLLLTQGALANPTSLDLSYCQIETEKEDSFASPMEELLRCRFQSRTDWHFGFTSNTIWMKVTPRLDLAESSSSKSRQLFIQHIYLSQIQIFEHNGKNSLQLLSELGLERPVKSWTDVLGGYSTPIEVVDGRAFFVRVQSKYPISLPIQILSESELKERRDHMSLVLTFYFAFVLALMLYNCFLYLITREQSFLFYVSTILGLHLFTNLAQFGVIKGFLLKDFLWLHAHVFHLAHVFSLIPVLFFASQFFKDTLKGWHLVVLRALAFVTLPMAAVGVLTDWHRIDQIMQINTTLFCLYLLGWTGSLAVRTRQRPAIYFFMAWSFLIVSWIINFFKISGGIPSIPMTDVMILLGSSMECLLLSLAIADRIRVLTLEKNAAVSRLSVIEERNKIFRKVSHDIRSPVTALNMLAQNLDSIPEEPRLLLRSATSRINDIANQLLDKSRPQGTGARNGSGTRRPELISALLEVLVSEKRVQTRSKSGVEIRLNLASDSYGLFSVVDSAEFKRMLSNLLNNAIEALPDSRGLVNLELQRLGAARMAIRITDNGVGVPKDLIPHLGKEGFTFGKSNMESGSGLGLYHAIKSTESFGGRLVIESDLGKGTTVTVELPTTQPPTWFRQNIELRRGVRVVIVDDDNSVHRVWEQRFKRFKHSDVQHFHSPAEFRDWIKEGGKADLFLVDFEFIGDSLTGLDLISGLSLGGKSALVTSHFEDPTIQGLCAKLGVQLIPKGLVGYVPIDLLSTANQDAEVLPK